MSAQLKHKSGINRFRAVSLSVAVAAIPPLCRAATTNYTAGDVANPTSWSQPTNWSAGEPSSTNTAVNIVSTSPTAYTVSYDYTGVSVTLSTLTISQADATGTLGNQLNVTSSIVTLNSTSILVGDSGGSGGSGTIGQSLGTVNFGQLSLGVLANDHGTYNLSGGAVNNNSVANGLIVGMSGTGTFAQTGGAVALASSNSNSGLYLGYNATGLGNYTQSAGTLVSNSFEFIGYSGTGNYNQTGGTNTTPSIMYIGFGGGSNGSYAMSNSAALSTDAMFVGGASTGSFTQSGSSTNTTTELAVGGDGNVANGTYSLSGSATISVTSGGVEILGYGGTGTLTQSGGTNNASGQIYVGGFSPITGTGFYSLSNGQINASSNETVGNLGTGTFNQSGGNNSLSSISSGLLVGGAGGVLGTYILSGQGQITDAGFEAVGVSGTGVFNQTGGTNNINGGDAIDAGLYLGENAGSTGTYSLSGSGQLNIAIGALLIGSSGTGVFNQTGGSVTVPRGTVLGYLAGSNGAYTLSGTGTINTQSEQIGFQGVGTFSQSGGTNTITGSNNLSLGISVGGNGTYNLSGGTAGVGGNVIVSGAPGSAGTGVLTVSGSGVLNVTGTISVFSNGSSAVNLNGGTISTGGLITNGLPSLFQWTTGTLNFNTAQTFDSGAGITSAQDGFGNSLAIGPNQILTVTGNETLGGIGAFSLTLNSGSIHSVSGTLNITPTGTLTQNAGSTLYAANIVQSGGTINGILQNQGTFTYQSGIFNARLLNEGSVNLGPSFTASNGIQNNANIFLSTAQIITANGAGLDNLGNLFLEGATLAGSGPAINDFGGTLQGPGTITPPFLNNGLLILSGVLTLTNATPAINNGTIQGTGTIVGNLSNTGGTINVTPGNLLAISNAWTNAGLMSMGGSGAQLGGGTITNAGTIQGAGDITAPIANSTGTIVASAGELDLAAAGITNAAGGQFQVTSGATIRVLQGLATNAGIISLIGGTFDNDGHPLNNTGQITGWGILRTGGAGLTNNGAFSLTGGASTVSGNITNSSSQTINIKYNPAIFTGNITNNGTIIATATTVTFAGSYSGNAYISDPSINIFQANVTITSGGSMTGSTGDAYIFSGDAVTNNGTFTNAGTLQSFVPITNSANFTQSGPQSWSPGATFTNIAGKAIFESNTKLYGLTITGGTFDITSTKLVVEPANKSATLAALQADAAAHSLISSTLPANFGLALLDNAITNFTTFGGNPVNSTDILLSPELLGDANLDGHVDLTDLSTILNNFGATTGAWTSGNFDNAPTIDLTDLSDVLNNFGQTNSNASTSQLPMTDYQLPLSIPAPEPSSLALLAFFPLATRRFRKCSRAKMKESAKNSRFLIRPSPP